MPFFKVTHFDEEAEVGAILAAVADGGKSLGLSPALSSETNPPQGGIVWILRKENYTGHLEVLYDPGERNLTISSVSRSGNNWTMTHAKLIAEYLADRLSGKLHL